MQHLLLIKYGEIHLKGLNRPYFKRLLKDRLKENLVGLSCRIFEQDARVYITGYDKEDEWEVILRAKNTFGVHAVCPAAKVDKDMEAICAAAEKEFLRYAQHTGKRDMTFKVKSRRQDKSFQPDSNGICREVGGYILDHIEGTKVDVHHPECVIEIEIRDAAYVYSQEQPAVGGMPIGSSGKAALMLSGGIDSPVAGYLMAKRGMEVFAVHFESPPYTGKAAREKVLTLAGQLCQFTNRMKVYVVRFTEIQEEIYERCQKDLLTVIMRRCMMRVAQALADREGAKALISGESLGQVASQTLDAIVVTDSVANRPVFRPLIGFDKDEIIEIARKIDTFGVSTMPGEDCCTVFVPKHPCTRPKLETVQEEETRIQNLDALIEEAAESAKCIEVDREGYQE